MTITVIQPDAAAGKDTRLRSVAPTTNYATETGGAVGMGTPGTAARLVKLFNVSTIASTEVVDDALLEVIKYGAVRSGGSTICTFDVHQILVDWLEAEATWNVRKTGTNWSTSGCAANDVDADSDVLAQAESYQAEPTGTLSWSSAALTGLVQGWVDGSVANNGLLLKASAVDEARPTGYAYDLLYFSDYTTASLRPKLTVTHHTPSGGLPPHILRPVYLPQGIVL